MTDTTPQWRIKPSKSRRRNRNRSRRSTDDASAPQRRRGTVPLQFSQGSSSPSPPSLDEGIEPSTHHQQHHRRRRRVLTKRKHRSNGNRSEHSKHHHQHHHQQRNTRQNSLGSLFLGDKDDVDSPREGTDGNAPDPMNDEEDYGETNHGDDDDDDDDGDDDDIVMMKSDNHLNTFSSNNNNNNNSNNSNNNNNIRYHHRNPSSSSLAPPHKRYRGTPPISQHTLSSPMDNATGLWSDARCWREMDGAVRHEVISMREVRECDRWFREMDPGRRGDGEPMVLVVAGPTGCGKTTLIRRKATEHGWDIEEWDNYAASTYLPDMPAEYNVPSMTRLESFRRFLSHSTRYVPLTFTPDDRPSHNNRKVITLVEEIPSIPRGRSRSERDQILSDIIASPDRCNPVVFMVNTHGSTSPHSALARIFPIHVLNTQHSPRPRIRILKLKPITDKRVAKVLRDISQRFSAPVPASIIDSISERASGDLRAAIQQLQLHCIGTDTHPAVTAAGRLTGASRRLALCGPPPARSTTRPEAEATRSGRVRYRMRPLAEVEREDAAHLPQQSQDHDVFVDVHHAAARILHATRMMDGELKHGVEAVRTTVHAAEDRMVGYIHHNLYSFAQDIDDVGHILDGISAADPLLHTGYRRPAASAATTTASTSFPVYGFHIAARSYIVHNQHPKASRFLPIRGPQLRTVEHTARSRATALQQLPFPRSGAAGMDMRGQRVMLTETTPFMKRLWKQAGLDGESERILLEMHQYRTARRWNQDDETMEETSMMTADGEDDTTTTPPDPERGEGEGWSYSTGPSTGEWIYSNRMGINPSAAAPTRDGWQELGEDIEEFSDD